MATTCSKCSRSTEKDRLPPGWKRHRDEVWCRECWGRVYVMRAVEVAVASPVDSTWEELRAVLRDAWRDATRLANWAVQRMYAAEPAHDPEAKKVPKHPLPYLYQEARVVAPAVDPASTTSILQAVQRRYMARRMDIRRASISLPTVRFPMPLPIHNQSWRLERDDGGRLMVSFRLGGARRRLYLRGGSEWRRQMAVIRQIESGELLAGELSIYQRPYVPGKNNPLMVKIAVWRAKKVNERRGETLYVRTGSPALWTYRVGDGEPRHLYADHLDRWITTYEQWRQRMAEDSKYEKRVPKSAQRGMQEARDRRARKHADRMNSFLHMSAAMLVGFARRNGVSRIEYDDTDRSRFASFPWAKMSLMVSQKAEESGIEFVSSGGESIEAQ